MGETAETDRQRLDKWLWHVRLQPTRTKAAAFIRYGGVRFNGVRTLDPAKPLRIGDVLTLSLPHTTMVVRVLSLLPHRVSASMATPAYEDISTP